MTLFGTNRVGSSVPVLVTALRTGLMNNDARSISNICICFEGLEGENSVCVLLKLYLTHLAMKRDSSDAKVP